MATNPNPKLKAAGATTLRARVLADFEAFGLKAGQIFEAEKEMIEAMFAQGHVDTHPDAIAYAESTGADIVQQPTVEPEAPAA